MLPEMSLQTKITQRVMRGALSDWKSKAVRLGTYMYVSRFSWLIAAGIVPENRFSMRLLRRTKHLSFSGETGRWPAEMHWAVAAAHSWRSNVMLVM
jgi:hypothetical protein